MPAGLPAKVVLIVNSNVNIRALLDFIWEDAPFGDITTDAIIGPESCSAVIRTRQAGMIAGIEEAALLFRYFGVTVTQDTDDGDPVLPDSIVMNLMGPARAILLIERTALNIIGRMSGIATITHEMMEIIKERGMTCRIAATRKTPPGLRHLDKKAVSIGGGDPHRFCLSDGFLIKDNHLALVPITTALAKAKEWSGYRKIEIEVNTCECAVTAAESGADILLLDNMLPAEVEQTIAMLEWKGLKKGITIEVSGGITKDNLERYLIAGVDLISMGSLTHSVINFDVSLEIVPEM